MIRIGNPHYLASTSGRCRRAENMGDSRWLGWSKMEYIHRPVDGGRTVTVHYVGKWENGLLKAVDDFKFK